MSGHYILIDCHGGYIFADSRDLAGYSNIEHGPSDAARLLADSIGDGTASLEERGFNHAHDGQEVYLVYRLDLDGSEAVPIVEDGQDQETIDAVLRHCWPWCQLARA